MKKKLFCMMLTLSLMIPTMPVHATEIQGEQEAVKESISEDMPSIDKVETTEGEAIPDNEKVVEEQEAIVDNEIVTEENESIVDNGELNEEKESIIDNTEDVIESEQTEEIVLDNENETDIDKNDTSEEEAEKVSDELEETQSEVQEKEEVEEIESEAAKEITEVDTIVESDEVIEASDGNAEDSMEKLLEECVVDEINTAGNSMSGATSISIGSTYSGRISDTNVVDYYKFIISSSGRVNLKSTAKIYRVMYRLYDAAGNQLWDHCFYWNDTTKQSVINENFDLTKGTYYLVVEKYYETGDYSFNLNYANANESFAETSNTNNNAINTASKIQLNKNYYGQIAINDDKDFYQFTIPSSGRVNLKSTAKIYRVTYRLYDAAGNQLWDHCFYWNDTTKQSVINENFDLTKGTYYLVVEKYYETGDYSFNLNYANANESFAETSNTNNNAINTASKIQLNKNYYGQIAINDDKDFYQFTIPSSGRVNLKSTAKIYRVTYRLYDAAGNQLWDHCFYWNDTTKENVINENFDLIKGTYYLIVEKYYETGNYSFNLNYANANESFAETSDTNNNAINTASKIRLNTNYSGQIAINDDKDFYQFTISSSGRVNLKSTAKIYRVTYRLYDAAGNQLWDKWVCWNDTTKKSVINENLDLTKGTYYLIVEKYYDTGNYQFSISTGPKFTDVPSGAFYEDAVEWAVNNDVTVGTGNNKFSPHNTCTRAQVVTFLWRAMGEPEPRYTKNIFSDVKEEQYYYKAVLWAVENGITSGTGNGKFEPNTPCTRAHVVTFLWRLNGEKKSYGSMNFADVSKGMYYTDAVTWAVNNDITKGTGNGRFSPNDYCTRGQIVTFLHRNFGE